MRPVSWVQPLSVTLGLLRTTFVQWQADKAPKLGAALAFYTVFSLAPLLVIALAVVAWAFGNDVAQREIQLQLQQLLGDQGAAAVSSLLANARQPETGWWATAFGFLTLAVGASAVFAELQDSLNIIWKVRRQPPQGIWNYARTRFLSFVMVLTVAFLLLVSLVVSALLSGLVEVVGSWRGSSALTLQIINTLLSIAVVTILFAMIFRTLPDRRIAWNDVWLGAAFTAVLFTVGKYLIGLYLGRATVTSAYGAAGSVVVILLWAYYSAQILFFGAEFTRAYARQFGSDADQPANTPDQIPAAG